MDKCECTEKQQIIGLRKDVEEVRRTLYGNGQKGIKQTVSDTAKDVSYMAKSVEGLKTTFYWLIGLFAGVLLALLKIAFG